jgi:outer membrane protein assembly factor BamB
MNDQSGSISTPTPSSGRAARPLPKLVFPTGLVLFYWISQIVLGRIDKPYFIGFMSAMIIAALCALLFLIWWLFNKRLGRLEKFLGLALMTAGIWIFPKSGLVHKSVTGFVLFTPGFQIMMAAAVIWLHLVKRSAISGNRAVFAVLVLFLWSGFTLVRFESPKADLVPQVRWRWTPTAEERFLAAQSTNTQLNSGMAAPKSAVPTGNPNAWHEFRGPNRDGVLRGERIFTDWKTRAPSKVWVRPVGPAWSSVTVVEGRLYTQEQRGDREVVTCYEAATGNPVWAHEDPTRFDEPVSGAGPRATPTVVGGRVFTLGGTGRLNCLNTDTGGSLWTRDIKSDSGGKVPGWAFSSSPLVRDGRVVVYGGGELGKSLLAYNADSGELAWSAPAGQLSYSSPQFVILGDVPQYLMLHDFGLTAVDAKSGRVLWETNYMFKGAPRCGQPRLIETNQLAVAALDGQGVLLMEVEQSGAMWKTKSIWNSKDLKTEFPDFVVHDGHAYGFDVSIFTCVDLSTGKRTWKEGRFGRGEVILLADQGLLLILSETGEAVLLEANPKAYTELGRFQALEGKTWNYPVVSGGKLFARNAEEMACYDVSEK